MRPFCAHAKPVVVTISLGFRDARTPAARLFASEIVASANPVETQARGDAQSFADVPAKTTSSFGDGNQYANGMISAPAEKLDAKDRPSVTSRFPNK